MISRDADYKCAILVALCMVVAVAYAACGGGGGGTSDRTTGGSGTLPGGNTKTPANPTPIATATPELLIIVRGGNILDKVHVAPPGSIVAVAPGVYGPFTLNASDVNGPITLLADVSGTLTGSPAAAVIIDAAHRQGGPAAAAITLSGIPEASALVLDGFTLRGGTTAAIVVDGSPSTVIQNCIAAPGRVEDTNPGDGMQFSGSDRSLLFNNLIFSNAGAGVRALGTDQLRIFNNTIYNNTDTGISIGSDQEASPNTVVENNIINDNVPFGIAVAANSVSTYYGDYNLNSDLYASGTPMGPHDLNTGTSAVPHFISPTGAYPDFHLTADSPAIDQNPNTLADLLSVLPNPAYVLSLLQKGTTQIDGIPDCQFADLGYHYPTDQICGVPTPTPTQKKK